MRNIFFNKRNIVGLILFCSVAWAAGQHGNYFIKGALKVGNSLASDASAILDVVSTDKGFLGPRMNESQRDAISSPATGLQIFNTDTNKLNVYDGAGWVSVGAGEGSGTGQQNYIENGTFEDGIDGVVATDANLFINAADYQPLNGLQSLAITKDNTSPAANAQVYIDSTTIDREQMLQAKPQYIRFNYSFISTYYPSGALILRAYDITNSVYLTVRPIRNLTDTNGLLKAGVQALAVCYPSNTTAQIRWILELPSDAAPGNTWFGSVDNILLGPDSPTSTLGQRSETISLAGSGNFTAGTLLVSKIGNQVKIEIGDDTTFASNATPASADGIVPEWARPQDLAINVVNSGSALIRAYISTSGQVTINFKDFSGTNSAQTGMGGSNAVISYISATSLGGLMSSFEASQQLMRARVKRITSAQSVANGATPKIQYNSVIEDNFGLWDAANYQFTAPRDLWAIVSAGYNMASNSTGRRWISIAKTGENLGTNYINAVNGDNQLIHISKLVYLEKGESVWASAYQSSGGPLDINASDLTSMEIVVLPDFTTLGAYSEAGQNYQSVNTTLTAWPLSADTWGDLTSRELDPGFYDIYPMIQFQVNGGTGSATYLDIGVSTFSGTTTTGLNFGDTRGQESPLPTANGSLKIVQLPPIRVTVTSPTFYYLKARLGGSASNIFAAWKLRAVKVDRP